MKLSAFALDYDGTIAQGDRLDPAVREAIADARTVGVTVLLVTGRILEELQRVAGDLHFVDGVVAVLLDDDHAVECLFLRLLRERSE